MLAKETKTAENGQMPEIKELFESDEPYLSPLEQRMLICVANTLAVGEIFRCSSLKRVCVKYDIRPPNLGVHLTHLAAKKCLDFCQSPDEGRGRPASYYRLTEAGHRRAQKLMNK